LDQIEGECRPCFDQPVHWAKTGLTEIGAHVQMVLGFNLFSGEVEIFGRLTKQSDSNRPPYEQHPW